MTEPLVAVDVLPQWLALNRKVGDGPPVPCRTDSPELWWGKEHDTAKGLCRGCRAQVACLDYALAADERFGIWGGRTAIERRPGAASDSVQP